MTISSANPSTKDDPAALAAFAVRGVAAGEARRHLAVATQRHSAAVVADAIATFSGTRVLSWDECLRLAQLIAGDLAGPAVAAAPARDTRAGRAPTGTEVGSRPRPQQRHQ